ncbi:MAG: alpha/beta fold hydrolase [Bacteroidetes bacterium]|nr:alpha/beta fold hydrolase [Bacteroidota bacterium]
MINPVEETKKLFNGVTQTASKEICKHIFQLLIKNRNRENVNNRLNDSEETEFKTFDGINLKGWIHNSIENSSGTIIFLHGFMDNSGSFFDLARMYAEMYNFSVASFDHRFHGWSQNGIPSFGQAESDDLRYFISHLQYHFKIKQPLIVFGNSLGAAAAQRAAIEDERIAGAFLYAPPAWPWDAIGKTTHLKTQIVLDRIPPMLKNNIADKSVVVGELIQSAYNRNILEEGDIRRYNHYPRHNPLVLYLMGTNDMYDCNLVHQVYDHWYQGVYAEYNVWPVDRPDDNKWFIEIPDANHDFYLQGWEPLNELVKQFIEIVKRRK